MNEDFKKEDSAVPLQQEQQVLALVKRLQQQIISLEKKVDILLSRSAQRTNEANDFSKPFRSFGHSQRQGKARRRDHSGERDFSAGRLDRQRGEENRGGLEQREKPFYRFDKRQGGSRRPGQRNKPFFRRRRDHS
ncbi:MAG: hypothetical protein ISS47_02750 [Candidatus Omnitrophica bacterium]|nr:hypothetical protein [Candidatus Omnitrophota bacterium]